MSPDVADKLYTTIFVAATVYMTGTLVKGAIDSMTLTPEEIEASNQRVMADSNRMRAQAEEEIAKEAKRVEERESQIRRENRETCRQLEAEGKTDSWEYISCYKYSYE